MTQRILTLRELNRTTLARQMLLERAALPVTVAVSRLVGLQAQLAQAPYAGLWTRLAGFRRADLADAIAARTVVKATLMRATLHLCTAEDYLWLRGTLQPALDLAFESVIKKRGLDLDYGQIVAAGQRYLAGGPRTFAEITAMFEELMPDADVGAMRYAVRTRLPLVQVPVEGGWSYPGNPQFTLAETWLGRPIPVEANLRELVWRYLAAYGPASVTDIQTWSGLGKLKEAMEGFRPDLVTYRDEGRRELFDLPDQPLPDPDTPAPARFLPEFDNLLLSHDKRTRVVADAYRGRVYLPGLRVAATFLVDGFVAGAWRTEKTKGAASLVVEPFENFAAEQRAALEEEGEPLLRFIEPEAKTYGVQFAE
jgi:hypothetical protein